MIDTGRNWLAPVVIKHLITGMAMLKLNVLHWHLTDDQSFPVSTCTFPELSKHTTFAPAAHYKLADLKEIVLFAAVSLGDLTERYRCNIH
jgi:hexosaminidase